MILSFLKMVYESEASDGDYPGIMPICLPPYGPVKADHLSAGQPVGKVPSWYRENTPLLPFEDLDCLAPKKKVSQSRWNIFWQPHLSSSLKTGWSVMP